MKYILLLIAFCVIGCAPGEGEDTTINISSGDSSVAGDPVTETTTASQCALSEDACAQQIDN